MCNEKEERLLTHLPADEGDVGQRPLTDAKVWLTIMRVCEASVKERKTAIGAPPAR